MRTRPYFQSDGNLSVLENETFVFEFNASDLDNDSLSYAIEYGDDAQFFDLNKSNGILTFLSPRDYENAKDNNSDNVYELTVSVSDGHESAIINLHVSVEDVFENQAPYFQSDGNLSVLENQTFVFEFNASDLDNDALSYAVEYGDDAQLFDLNKSNGILTFLSPRDYENAKDNNSDNVYELTVSVSDGHESAIINLHVSVEDVFENQAPYFQSDGDLSVLENQTFVFEFNASDLDNDALSYAIEYGDDAQFFDLNKSNGILTFLSPRDYENAKDNNSDNVYELTVSVSDGHESAIINLHVSVEDVFENQAPYFQTDGNLSVLENQTFVFEFNASDLDNDALSYAVEYGDDAQFFDLNKSNGILTFLSPRDYENAKDNNSDNVYELTVSVSDGHESAIINLHVEVRDIDDTAPVITLTGDDNITHEAGKLYTDAGARWNDSVDGNGIADANGTVDYEVPGTYHITYTYTDNSGNFAHKVIRTIHVVDTISPIITLIGDANITISTGMEFIDPGAVWTDFVDGEGQAEISGHVDQHTPGIYRIEYNYKDSSGNNAQPVVRTVHVIQENRAPESITLSQTFIAENLPKRTLVGYFDAFDPDDNQTLTYRLLSSDPQTKNGTADHNSSQLTDLPFILEENGTLFTTRILDYESDPQFFELQVLVEDQKGASLTQFFVVELINVIEDKDGDGTEDAYDEDRDGDGISNSNEILAGTDPDNPYSRTNKPIVNTLDGQIDANGSIYLSGNVLSNGLGKIDDFGFVISSSPSLNRSESTVYWVRGVGDPNRFTLKVTESPFLNAMYFRSWARNSAGYGIGQVKKVIIPEPPQFWWGDITEEPGGWKSSPWFGTFIYYQQGWLFHTQLGWLYASSNNEISVWLWKEGHGWLWTKEDVWPYLYKNDSASWIYFTTSQNGSPVLYDYLTSSYRGLE